MEEKIFPNVEYLQGSDIPSKAFFRNTSKIAIKASDVGLTMLGITYPWDKITSVKLNFFNGNPYLQLDISGNTKHNLFFETKFYYRKIAPWFGGSSFLTTEFVKILETHNLYTVSAMTREIEKNIDNKLIHTIWNNFFWILPPSLLVITIIILFKGLNP